MKKKTIKKPKFWKFLLPRLILALLIALYIDIAVYTNIESVNRMWFSGDLTDYDTIDLITAELSISKENGTEFPDRWTTQLVSRLSYDESGYYEVLDGTNVLLSTKQYGYYEGDNGVYYLLADDPEFKERFYKDTGAYRGTIDEVRRTVAGTRMIFFQDVSDIGSEFETSAFDDIAYSLANRLIYGFLELTVPRDVYYPETIVDVYVDEEKGVFHPGKVEMRHLKTGEIKTFDYTPADTTGLRYRLVGGSMIRLKQPWANSGGEVTDNTNIRFNDGSDVTVRHTTFKTYSVIELFPFQVFFIGVLIALIFILIAVLIARARYLKMKSIYDVMEYRRVTSDSMAHDLKTPLAIISAYSENMREETDPDKLREYAEKMGDTVNSANHLLESILNFSRSESAGTELKPEEISVRSVIDKAVESRMNFFDAYDINVTTRGDDIKIKTDKRLFEQAIENLISNCADHSENKTEVDILISKNTIEFTNVSDHKIDNVDELKKPFVKGSGSRGASGTGLGLAIVENDLGRLGFKLRLKYVEPKFTATVVLK